MKFVYKRLLALGIAVLMIVGDGQSALAAASIEHLVQQEIEDLQENISTKEDENSGDVSEELENQKESEDDTISDTEEEISDAVEEEIDNLDEKTIEEEIVDTTDLKPEIIESSYASDTTPDIVTNWYNADKGCSDEAYQYMKSKILPGETFDQPYRNAGYIKDEYGNSSDIFYAFYCTNSDRILYIKSFSSDGIIPSGNAYSKGYGLSDYSPYKIVIDEGVKEIGDYAFYNLTSVKSVTMSDTVTKVGNRAFFGLSQMTNLTLSTNLKQVDDYAFAGCSVLTSVNLGELEGLTSIGERAFYGADIKNIEISDSVETIGAGAFARVNGMGKVQRTNYSVTMGTGVKTIGAGAFDKCAADKIYIKDLSAWCQIDFADDTANPMCSSHSSELKDSDNPLIYRELYLNGSASAAGQLVIPSDVVEIKPYTFAHLPNMSGGVYIPNTVEKIDENAFYKMQSYSAHYFYFYNNDCEISGDAGTFSCVSSSNLIFIYSNNKSTISQFISNMSGSGQQYRNMIRNARDYSEVRYGGVMRYATTEVTNDMITFEWDDSNLGRLLDEDQYMYQLLTWEYGSYQPNYMVDLNGVSNWKPYTFQVAGEPIKDIPMSMITKKEDGKCSVTLPISTADQNKSWRLERIIKTGDDNYVVTGYIVFSSEDAAQIKAKPQSDGSVAVNIIMEQKYYKDFAKVDGPVVNTTKDISYLYLYESDQIDGTYEKVESGSTQGDVYKFSRYEKNLENYVSSDVYRWEATITRPNKMDSSTGEVKEFYWYVELYSDEGELLARSRKTGYEPESLPVSGLEDYYDLVFVQWDVEHNTYKEIKKLDIHKGVEHAKIGLAYKKIDGGSLVLISEVAPKLHETIKWKTKSKESGDQEPKEDKTYVEILDTEESSLSYNNWVIGKNITSDDNTAYIDIAIKTGDYAEPALDRRLPVNVLEPEEGKEYYMVPSDKTVYSDKEELLEAIWKQMSDRVAEYKEENHVFSVYSTQDIHLTYDDVYRVYSEHEGTPAFLGDYLLLGGMRDSTATDYDYELSSKKTYSGVQVCKEYTFSTPCPTWSNASWELQVNAKVKSLLSNGGALYSANTSGNMETKAKAAFDYIVYNTHGASDMQNLDNHTAYQVLINHQGTCEAYALAYYRLCREMGVPCKIIEGMDSAYHTYTIVQMDDGYWYYVDPSANIWKRTYSSFSRATEQPLFRCKTYVKNYISHIKGYATGAEGNVLISLTEQGEYIYAADDIDDAHDYIKEALEEYEEDEKPNYTITLKANYTEMFSKEFVFDDIAPYVTLDLNGHTISNKGSTAMQMSIGKVKNGTIKLNQTSDLILEGNKEKISAYREKKTDSLTEADYFEFDNIKFVANTRDEWVYICSAVHLLDTCSFSGINRVFGATGCTVDCDIVSDGLSLFSERYNWPDIPYGYFLEGVDSKFTGNIKVKYFWNLDLYLDDIHFGRGFCAPEFNNLTVTSGTMLQMSTNMMVTGSLSLSGPVVVTTERWEYESFTDMYEPAPYLDYPSLPTINLVKQHGSGGEVLKQATINMTDATINEYQLGKDTYYKMEYDMQYQTKEQILEWWDVPGVKFEEAFTDRIEPSPAIVVNLYNRNVSGVDTKGYFEVGDTVGLFKNVKGIRYADGRTAKAVTNPMDIAKYIYIPSKNGGNAVESMSLDDGLLWSAKTSVYAKLFYASDEEWVKAYAAGTEDAYEQNHSGEPNYSEKTISDSSLKKILEKIAAMDKVECSGAIGNFTGKLYHVELYLDNDVVVPFNWSASPYCAWDVYPMAKSLENSQNIFHLSQGDIAAARSVASIELQGYTFTTQAKLGIHEGIIVKSSASKAGSIVNNQANGIVLYADDSNQTRLQNVVLSSSNGMISVVPAGTMKSDEADFITQSSSINCQSIVLKANATFENVTVKEWKDNANDLMVNMTSVAAQNVRLESTENLQATITGKLSATSIAFPYVSADVINADKIQVVAGTESEHIEGGILKVREKLTVKELFADAGSIVDVQILEVPTTGSVGFADDAKLYVHKSATFNNFYSVEKADYYITQPEKMGMQLYKEANAEITWNSFKKNADAKIAVGLIEKGNPESENVVYEEYVLLNVQDTTKLFTTSMSSFPVEKFDVLLPVGSTSKYTNVYQDGKGIYAGALDIKIKAKTANDTEELLATYSKWADASSYIEKLANAGMYYIVELTGDVVVNGALIQPSKAAGLEYRGVAVASSEEEEKQIKLTFSGDLKLLSDIQFRNLKLVNTSYNATTATHTPYNATITLNGHKLTYDLVQTESINKIVGNGKTDLVVENGSQIKTQNAITNIQTLKVNNSELRIGTSNSALTYKSVAMSGINTMDILDGIVETNGSIAVTNLLKMNDATILTNGKVNLVNVESNSETNQIVYGGNATDNSLTITGVVSTDADNSEMNQNIYAYRYVSAAGEAGAYQYTTDAKPETLQQIRENAPAGATLEYETIRKAAIEVKPQKVAESGYAYDAILLNATKTTAGWFVVERDTTAKTIGALTHRSSDGKTIRYGAIRNGAVILESRDAKLALEAKDTSNGGGIGSEDASETALAYNIEGVFPTLQEALAEIDRLAVSTNEYRVLIKQDEPIEGSGAKLITSGTANLTMPGKLTHLIIASDTVSEENQEAKKIYYKNALALKSDVTLDHIQLVPQTAGTITLGNFQLTLEQSEVEDLVNATTGAVTPAINGITGSSVNGTSALTLRETSLVVNGAINNVGTVGLEDARLQANGTVNIGVLAHEEENTTAELWGVATVTRGNVTGTAYKNVVTKITPSITLNGKVLPKNPVRIGLNEKITSNDRKKTISYVPIRLRGDDPSEFYGDNTTATYDMSYYIENVGTCPIAKAANLSVNVLGTEKDAIEIIKVAGDNLTDSSGVRFESQGYMTKTSQYITYAYGNLADAEVNLVYFEDLKKIIAPYRSFADAVTEINNLKTKRAYTIQIRKEEGIGAEYVDTTVAPKALTMPGAANISSLTIESVVSTTEEASTTGGTQGAGSAGSTDTIQPVNIYYTGNISLTSATTLENVNLIQCVKMASDNDAYKKNEYYPADEIPGVDGYPAAISFALAGNTLNLEKEITFNTPVKFSGNANSVWNLNGRIYTDTNEKVIGLTTGESLLVGNMTGIGTVNLPAGKYLRIEGMVQNPTGKATYTAASLNAINVNNGGSLTVTSFDGAGKPSADVKITNLVMDGSILNNAESILPEDGAIQRETAADTALYSNGKMNLVNVTLASVEASTIDLYAALDFNITGTLTNTTNAAKFTTRLNNLNRAKAVPYLNISGTILNQNPMDQMEVEVLPNYAETETDSETPIVLDGASVTGTKNQAQLLTTKNGQIGQFRPSNANLIAAAIEGSYGKDSVDERGGVGPNGTAYSDKNPEGYILAKAGNNLYVYYGSDVKVALCTGNAVGHTLADIVSAAEDKEYQLLGYYPTYAEAVTAIDVNNQPAMEYTIMLLQDQGIDANGNIAPVNFTFPSKAKTVYVASAYTEVSVEPDTADQPGAILHTIFYSNALTLKSNTVLTGMALAPVAKKTINKQTVYVDTPLNISAGNFDLEINNIAIEDVDGDLESLVGVTQGGIKDITGGKGTLTIEQYGLKCNAITGFNTVKIKPIQNYEAEENVSVDLPIKLQVSGAVKVTKLILGEECTLEQTANQAITVTNMTMEYGSKLNSLGTGAITIANLTMNGNATVLAQNSANRSGGTVNITKLISNSEKNGEVISINPEHNKIFYAQTAKSVSNLTIGSVEYGSTVGMGDTERVVKNEVVLNMRTYVEGQNAEYFVLNADSNVGSTYNMQANYEQIKLGDNRKLATINNVPTDAFIILINDEDVQATLGVGSQTEKVKANKGLYMEKADNSVAGKAIVTLKNYAAADNLLQPVWTSNYLDWAQAIQEINNQNMMQNKYILEIAEQNTDTVMTDTYRHGAMTMPADNKAAFVKVMPKGFEDVENPGSVGSSSAAIYFTGNITAYANVEFEHILFMPMSGANADAFGTPTITMKQNSNKNADKTSVLTMKDSYSAYDAAAGEGMFSTITGVKAITNVNVLADKLTLSQGFANNINVQLEDTTMYARGNSTINTLYLSNKDKTDKDSSAPEYASLKPVSYTGFGATTINDVYIEQTQLVKDAYGIWKPNAYVAGRLNKTGAPTLTINGMIEGMQLDTDNKKYRVLPMKVLAYESTVTNPMDPMNGYMGTPLLIAPKASADSFICAMTMPNDYVYYKNLSNHVLFDNLNNMAVRIAKEDVVGYSYATSYYDAISMINAMNDASAKYTLEFLPKAVSGTNGEIFQVCKTGKNNAFGTLLMPTKGRFTRLTICGQADKKQVIEYTGTMSLNGDVTFKNIQLTEGSVNTAGVFQPMMRITPNMNNYVLTFDEGAYTLQAEGEFSNTMYELVQQKKLTEEFRGHMAMAQINLASLSGANGTFETLEGQRVYCMGNATGNTLKMTKASDIAHPSEFMGTGSFTFKNAELAGTLSVNKAINITNLTMGAKDCVRATSGALNLTNVFVTDESLTDAEIALNTGSNYFEAEIQDFESTISIGTLRVEHTKSLGTYAADEGAKGKVPVVTIKGSKAINLTNIEGTSNQYGQVESAGEKEKPVVFIGTATTKKARTTDLSTTQLAMNGVITGAVAVQIAVVDNVYGLDSTTNKNTQLYYAVAKSNLGAFNVAGTTVSKNQKLATIPKAEIQNIDFMYLNYEQMPQAALMSEDIMKRIDTYNSFKKVVPMDIDGDGEIEPLRLYKQDGGLYLTTQEPSIRLEGYADSAYENQTYSGVFMNFQQAVAEIDRAGSTTEGDGKTAYYKLILLKDLGEEEAPLKSLAMPTKARQVMLTSEESEEGQSVPTIYTAVSSLALKSNVWFNGADLCNLKATTVKVNGQNTTKYVDQPLPVSMGAYELRVTGDYRNDVASALDPEVHKKNYFAGLTGAAKGTLMVDEDSMISFYGNVANVGTIQLNKSAMLYASGNISGTNELQAGERSELTCNGNLTVINMTLEKDAILEAVNVTGSGMTTLNGGNIYATNGTAANVGKITLTNVTVNDIGNTWVARQNTAGLSQITVNGTIVEGAQAETNVNAIIGDEGQAPITVGVLYNSTATTNLQAAKLYSGMVLLTAPKVSDGWFVPMYNKGAGTYREVPDTMNPTALMGNMDENWGLFKTGKTITYGDLQNREVQLLTLTRTPEPDAEEGIFDSLSDFATFEEAVAEINNLGFYKIGLDGKATKQYADYQIELFKDVEIGNTAGDGKFNALTLPTKAGVVYLVGHKWIPDEAAGAENPNTGDGEPNEGIEDYFDIAFSGNVTIRSNMEVCGVSFTPMKTVSGKGVPTTANWSFGNFNVTFGRFKSEDASGNPLIGSVTGNTSKGQWNLNGVDVATTGNVTSVREICLMNNASLTVRGNLSAYQLSYEKGYLETPTSSLVDVKGNTTLNLLKLAQGTTNEACFKKAINKTLTLNGATLSSVVDGKTVKTNHTIIGGENGMGSPLKVAVDAENVPVGTKILTDKYLNEAFYQIYNAAMTIQYSQYVNGTNLMSGKWKVE